MTVCRSLDLLADFETPFGISHLAQSGSCLAFYGESFTCVLILFFSFVVRPSQNTEITFHISFGSPSVLDHPPYIDFSEGFLPSVIFLLLLCLVCFGGIVENLDSSVPDS